MVRGIYFATYVFFNKYFAEHNDSAIARGLSIGAISVLEQLFFLLLFFLLEIFFGFKIKISNWAMFGSYSVIGVVNFGIFTRDAITKFENAFDTFSDRRRAFLMTAAKGWVLADVAFLLASSVLVFMAGSK